jgi:rare lipoprotein A
VKLALGLLLLCTVAACGRDYGPTIPAQRGATQEGKATWYGPGFDGRRTASGERFDQEALTAAHRTLPLGSVVRVTNTRNGRRVIVRINDRGPYGGGGRIIDLSKGAARRLDMLKAGVVPVLLEVQSVPPPRARRKRRH